MQTSYVIYTKELLKKFLIQGSKRVPYSGIKKGSLLKDQREFLLKDLEGSRFKDVKDSLFKALKMLVTQE